MGSTGTGSRSQTTNTFQRSETNPWAPTEQPLTNLVGQLNGQIGNTGINANEQSALDQLRANAQAGNPYTGQVQSLATDLFGGGTDRTGLAQGAYDDYKAQAQPYLSQDYLNPYNNPAFQQYLQTATADAANSANAYAASMGRDGSGYATQNLARGIAQGTAPIFANQYNQNVATQTGMMGNLYNAGNSTTGLLSGLDQTALGNRMQGITAGEAALNAQNSGANQLLNVEQMQRNLPLQNIGNISGLLTPIAQLGGRSEGTGYAQQQGTFTQPLSQTVGNWMDAGMKAGPAMSSVSSAIGTGLGWFSDRRLKEDIKPVGKLDNGLTVYSYRYKIGGPVMIGLMADEVEAVAPEAIGEVAGYKTVDYERAVRS